jgi:Flp pilus assembly protein TadD/uncharacterized RDD family membrane protein YckC
MDELEDAERIGFGLRLVGTVIDLILVTGLSIATGIFGGAYIGRLLGGAVQGSEAGGLGLVAGGFLGFFGGIILVAPVLGTLYYLVEGLTGWTLGKLILGQRIANSDGTKAGVGTLLDRYAIKNIGWILWLIGAVLGGKIYMMLSGIAGLVVFLGCFMALGAERMALHDRVANTAVFRRADVLGLEAENIDSPHYYGVLILVLLVAGGVAANMGIFERAGIGRDRTPVETGAAPGAAALTPEAAKAAEAHAKRGIQFFNERKYADVIREYDKAIKIDPRNEEYYYMRGTAYEWTGDHATAITDLKKVVATMPEHLNAWDWLGRANFNLNKLDDAIASFDKVIEGNPQNAPQFLGSAYFNRATAYDHKGNKDQARSDYEQSCRLGYKEGCTRFDIMSRGR